MKWTCPYLLIGSIGRSSIIDDTSFEIKLAEKQGELLTMKELKNRVVKKETKIDQKKVLQFFDEVISELELAGRIGYAEVFTACRSTIKKLFESKDKIFVGFIW